MKLDQAKILAEKWVAILSEHCERIEIAGGVRRGKAEPPEANKKGCFYDNTHL